MPKRVVIRKPGSYERLEVEPYTPSALQPNEVLIEVKACGVNFADCCVRMGVYRPAAVYVGWPITPGFEVAGIVSQVGSDVKDVAVGSKVIAITRFGGYCSHLSVKKEQIYPMPEGFSFAQAAGFPAVFLTAYYSLFELAHPRPGTKLLVHSAAGGVGSALVQLGKIAECRTLGVVGASHKVDAVHALGADAVVDKSTEDLWKKAEAFAPDGFGVICDANGPATLGDSYRHLGPGGKLVVYGFHTMLSKGRGKPNWIKVAWDYLRCPRINPMNLTTDNHSVMGFNLAYLFDQLEVFQEAIDRMFGWVQEGKLHAPTVTEFALDDVQEAHRQLESGQTIGKLVLIPD